MCYLFSLAAFNILSLCLVFFSLISMWLGVFLLGFILCGTLCASWTRGYCVFHAAEIFNYNVFINFLIPFLFLFFFWDPYNLNVDAFDIVPGVSETILSSFHSFYFILLFRRYFHHFIFLIHSSASDILLFIPSRVFLISVIVLFVFVCLFFHSSRSLLHDCCTFSPFPPKVFDHLYYHYSEFFFR